MKLTIASKVTIARICLIPVFIVCYHLWGGLWSGAIPAAVFVLASMTDWVDGYLARSRNEVTDLGKFMDPLADKILVCAAMLALVELQAFPSWVALIIIAREFIVSGLRMVAAAQGKVIAASYYGKVKTVLQILAILLFIVKDTLQIKLLGGGIATGFTIFSWVVLAAAVAMTLVSLLDYFNKTKDLLGFTSKKEA